MLRAVLILLTLVLPLLVAGQDIFYVKGIISNKVTGKPIEGAHIRFSSGIGAVSSSDGAYTIKLKSRKELTVRVSYIGYRSHDSSVDHQVEGDTTYLNFELTKAPSIIPHVVISGRTTPDTIFGSFQYCVADFEFYQDKFLLLTYKSRDEKSCSLILQGKKGKLLLSTQVNGQAISLYKDYADRYYVICEELVYRVYIESRLLLLVPISTAFFEANIKPGIDMVGEKIIFSNYRWDNPEFSYYTVWRNDTIVEELKHISDAITMRMYRFEYYYLNNVQRVAAWKFADQYDGIDKFDAAALMTDFRNNFYFDPLYAPMFVVNDTVLIFDHHASMIYRFDHSNKVVDSVGIAYHKLKGAMKWKKELVKDVANDEIYAVFQKNGYYYLSYIDTKQGTVESTFKMSDKYTEKMKIKDDYVYYVYDPQDKYQTPFLYRERIRL